MDKVLFRVKDADGVEKTIVEEDSTGRFELITEYDRRPVSEAYVHSLARANGFSLSASKPPMMQGGLPSLGKKR
ncbi:MAG: hypothetical protein ABSG70_20115 [Terriglobales bacterium]